MGLLLGMFWQKYRDDFKLEKAQSVFKILSSDVVPSIVSYGTVTNIDGRKITMAFNNDLITVKIKDSAAIYNLVGDNGNDQSKADFNQIKIGDSLNVTVDVNTDGTFEGESVINFSQR